MRSLRIDDELDSKLQRAAALKGESVSEFIRHAVEQRANEALMVRVSDSFTDVAGVIHGGGGRARESGKAFTQALAKKRSSQ